MRSSVPETDRLMKSFALAWVRRSPSTLVADRAAATKSVIACCAAG
jgi:hypothetical protein